MSPTKPYQNQSSGLTCISLNSNYDVECDAKVGIVLLVLNNLIFFISNKIDKLMTTL